MCRNITELRGLEPPATDDEVEAAARQFIRKVSGLQKPPAGAEAAYERAIAHVTAEVHALLDILPARPPQLTEASLEIENHNLRSPRFQGMATRLGRPFESVLRP